MGQEISKRRYDAFARQRIADKLDFIQRLNPGLSQEDMAGEIEELTDSIFDRKYFLRLRKGNLSDAVADRIVQWIEKSHDPNFSGTLQTDQQFFSKAAVSNHSVLTRKEWVKILRDEALLIIPWALAAFGLPEEYRESCSFEVRAVSFLADTRVIRMSIHRKGAIFGVPLFLLERGGILTPLESMEQLSAFDPLLDMFTLADVAAFYFECIEASRPVELFASTVDLTYHLHDKQGLHIGAAASFVASHFAAMFEPPMVQKLTDGYVLRIDAGSRGQYRRLLIEINDRLELSIASDRALAEFPDKSVADKPLAPAGASATSLNTNIAPYLDILREVPTGRMLVRVFELRPAPIRTVPGPREAFIYDEQINIIVHSRPAASAPDPEHTALALAACLRFLDQFLIGLTFPDPMVDTMKYATASHTKNLDAIVHVCKIAIEFKQTPRGASAHEFIKTAGLAKVFDAVQRDAATEEIFDAYANS